MQRLICCSSLSSPSGYQKGTRLGAGRAPPPVTTVAEVAIVSLRTQGLSEQKQKTEDAKDAEQYLRKKLFNVN